VAVERYTLGPISALRVTGTPMFNYAPSSRSCGGSEQNIRMASRLSSLLSLFFSTSNFAPPYRLSAASLSGVEGVGIATIFFAIFFAIFFDLHRTNFPRFHQTFHQLWPTIEYRVAAWLPPGSARPTIVRHRLASCQIHQYRGRDDLRRRGSLRRIRSSSERDCRRCERTRVCLGQHGTPASSGPSKHLECN
jgi:hypothetical protein